MTNLPSVFCNSWPKAGTHLLLSLTKLIFDGLAVDHPNDIKCPRGPQDALAQMRDALAASNVPIIFKGHLPYSPWVLREFEKMGIKPLFVIRDPRDVICSTFRWLSDLRQSWSISKWLRELSTDGDRVSALIQGVPRLSPFDLDYAIEWHKPLPDRYSSLTSWAVLHPEITFRYEDLTGQHGTDMQISEINRVINYLGGHSVHSVEYITQHVIDRNSQTFHSGGSISWRDIFSDEHCAMFVDLGGEALVEQFGYPATISPTISNLSWEWVTLSEHALQVTASSAVNKIPDTMIENTKSASMKQVIRKFARRVVGLPENNDKFCGSALANRVYELETKVDIIMNDPWATWLYANRSERMDATVDLWQNTRRRFHLARYEFAGQYIRGMRVADIASGTGYGPDYLRTDAGAELVIGVEIDSTAVEYAEARHAPDGVSYLCCSGDATAIDNASIDVVTSFETLEHVPNDDALLREFARILKPGGVLVLSVPNDWEHETHPHHVRDYTRDTLRQLLEKYFTIEKWLNQNSGGGTFNRSQPAGIVPTTDDNHHLAECYIVVCRKGSS